MSSNKEFLELLNSVIEEKKFSVTLTDGKEYSFKQLTTSQLRDLVKSVVDSPLTQASFHTTISKAFYDCLVDSAETEFNIIDRTLFVLASRINAISSEVIVETESGEKKSANLEIHIQKLTKLIEEGKFKTNQLHTEGTITVEYGIPSISTEDKLNKEIYDKEKFNTEIEKQEDLRNIIGDLFINELAKCIKKLKIGEKELDLNNLSFAENIKIVEKLPASAISAAINFVERYKKTIKEALTVDGNTVLPIDGTLFSLR